MELNDENLRALFEGAADFVIRPLRCGKFSLTAYAIDGLTSGGDTSHYIIKPLMALRADTVFALYGKALAGGVWNSVARPCRDLDAAADFLVNGFCVVTFPGAGALAFEVKTQEKRSPSPPGGGEHRQRGQGCLRGDSPLQYQPDPPPSSDTCPADPGDHCGQKEPDQCVGTLGGGHHIPGAGGADDRQTRCH